MNTRRNFIKTVGAGAVVTSVAPGILAKNTFSASRQKQIIIGIIGAENSHTAGYGRVFNVEKKLDFSA